jgi:hypothetical protein
MKYNTIWDINLFKLFACAFKKNTTKFSHDWMNEFYIYNSITNFEALYVACECMRQLSTV